MTTSISEPTASGWGELAVRLASSLHLSSPPLSISFGEDRPEGVDHFDAPMSDPAPDGRRGRVPAGCVFWIRAAERTFSTVAEDHGNCSVGSVTHGFATLEDVGGNDDVGALLETGWVTAEAVAALPTVRPRPGAVTYGPLGAAAGAPDPDVVLVRVNPRQMMVLSDALPGLRIEGKPQCHIVALAKEQGEVAASVGCALSRARTGMPPEEMTVAIPARRLHEVVEAVASTAEVDTIVAKYAADDARRFSA